MKLSRFLTRMQARVSRPMPLDALVEPVVAATGRSNLMQHTTRLTEGMPEILGRRVDGFLFVEHTGERFRLFLTFADGTHYELYGKGLISGSRELHKGGWDAVTKIVRRDRSVVQKTGYGVALSKR